MDRSSRVGGPPTNFAAEWFRLVFRLAFFGGMAGLCLYWRSGETGLGNRNALLVLALLLIVVGLAAVRQSVLDLLWLRAGQRQVEPK